MTESFLPALDAAALPPGKSETVLLNGRRIAIFNVGGEFFALDDDCPHRGGPLGPGWVDADKCAVAWLRLSVQSDGGQLHRRGALHPQWVC